MIAPGSQLLQQPLQLLVLRLAYRFGAFHESSDSPGRRSAEESRGQLLECLRPDRTLRLDGKIDVSTALALMAYDSRLFQESECRPHRRIAGRVRQLPMNVLGGDRSFTVKDRHDLTFSATQAFVGIFDHSIYRLVFARTETRDLPHEMRKFPHYTDLF